MMSFLKFFAVGAAAVYAAGMVSGKSITGNATVDKFAPFVAGGAIVGLGHKFLGT